MTVLRHIRLLPLLVLVSLLSFVVRAGTLITGLSDGLAFAQEEVKAEAPPLPSADAAAAKPADDGKGDGAKAAPAETTADGGKGPPLPASPAASMPEADTPGAKPEGWKDATDTEMEFSEKQEALYKDLSKRREELDKREKDLATREALLEAGKKELDQKLQEMTVVRNQIEGLLQDQSEQEKARVQSLVKIYETMKAKEAAAVFNTLDMDILIRILQNMSERKTAPILAQMDPERVQQVTTLLAQKSQIPTIPGE